MPQMFDRITELRFVDWDSIAVYTCVNPKCMVEKYSQEFGYIAFSEDFRFVKVGDEKEVAAARKAKLKELAELDAVEQEEMKKLELEQAAEMKMEKEASQQDAPADKKVDNSEQVRTEVEEGLGDLLGSLDLN